MAAATAHHLLEKRVRLMAAWHEDAHEPGIGVAESLRALLSEWWRRVFRTDATH